MDDETGTPVLVSAFINRTLDVGPRHKYSTRTFSLSVSYGGAAPLHIGLKNKSSYTALPLKQILFWNWNEERNIFYEGGKTRGQISQYAWSQCSPGRPSEAGPDHQGRGPFLTAAPSPARPHSSYQQLLGDGPGGSRSPTHTHVLQVFPSSLGKHREPL